MTGAVATGGSMLWYVSRSSGLALLLLLSVVVALGVATRLGSAPRRVPRFVVGELHRMLSLYGIAFLVLHVVTAVVDPYVSIGWAATVVPFASHYRAAALGFGALAVDVLGAVVVTSVLRHRIGRGTWRAVHWLVYAAWPVAVVHAFSAGPDAGLWWAAAVEWGSIAVVAVAALARILAGFRGPAGPPPAPRSAPPALPATAPRSAPASPPPREVAA